MGKIYAIVNQKNEYYNDWNDSFIKKINQDILYFDLKCAESILKNLDDRDDMYCDGCKIVELTICPKQQIADLEAKLAESKEQCRECKHLNKKIELNIKNKLMAEIQELYKQLAETDKLMQEYLSKCLSLEQQLEDEKYKTGELCSLIDEIRYEDPKIKELQQKLEEKENLLGLIEDGYYTPTNIVKRQLKEEYQTAIAVLEKLLEKTQTLDVMVHSGHYINQKKVNVVFKDAIDQQIKELKGDLQ